MRLLTCEVPKACAAATKLSRGPTSQKRCRGDAHLGAAFAPSSGRFSGGWLSEGDLMRPDIVGARSQVPRHLAWHGARPGSVIRQAFLRRLHPVDKAVRLAKTNCFFRQKLTLAQGRPRDCSCWSGARLSGLTHAGASMPIVRRHRTRRTAQGGSLARRARSVDPSRRWERRRFNRH
jgi:hypothetical protein